MSNPNLGYTDELKSSLTDEVNLQKSIQRYGKIFPEKVEKFQAKLHLTPEEIMIGFYISDYVLTSDEITDMSDEERLDKVFEILKMGKDDCNISFQSNLKLMFELNAFVKQVKKNIKFQSDRGFPLSVIKSQVIESKLSDVFNNFLKIFTDVDYRWLLASIEALYNSIPVSEIYPYTSSIYDLREFNKSNYYINGKILLDRLNIEIREIDDISKSSYDSQLVGNFSILCYNNGESLFHASVNTNENHDLQNPGIMERLEGIIHNIPSIQDISGEEQMRLLQFEVKMNVFEKKTGYLMIVKSRHKQIVLMLFASELEDINYNQLRTILGVYLENADSIISLDGKQIKTILQEWAMRILVSQVVLESELDIEYNDNIRDKNWTVNALLNGINGESIDFFAKTSTHRLFQSTMMEISDYLGKLHDFIDLMYVSKELKMEVYPLELYFEKNENNCHYLIMNKDDENISAILLKTKEKAIANYIAEKQEGINRKFTSMKLKDLKYEDKFDYSEWVLRNLGFDCRNDFELETGKMAIGDLKSTLEIETEQDAEISTQSVSKRLQSLEKNKNTLIDVQMNLFEFMLNHIHANIDLALMMDPKMSNFITPERKKELVSNARKTIDTLIDNYGIYKLSGQIGRKAIDIINTIDGLFLPGLREAMFKLSNLEADLKEMHANQVSDLLATIQKSMEMK